MQVTVEVLLLLLAAVKVVVIVAVVLASGFAWHHPLPLLHATARPLPLPFPLSLLVRTVLVMLLTLALVLAPLESKLFISAVAAAVAYGRGVLICLPLLHCSGRNGRAYSSRHTLLSVGAGKLLGPDHAVTFPSLFRFVTLAPPTNIITACKSGLVVLESPNRNCSIVWSLRLASLLLLSSTSSGLKPVVILFSVRPTLFANCNVASESQWLFLHSRSPFYLQRSL